MIIVRITFLLIGIHMFFYSLLFLFIKMVLNVDEFEPTTFSGCWPPEPSLLDIFMDSYASAMANSPALFLIASISIMAVIYFTYHISFANVVPNKSSSGE